MAHGFVPVERDQALLLPPDLREWLPEDHLAWFVLDAVEQLDLSGFYARYRTGAQGRAAYDPEMMVALMLYGYATGIRSSRDIERHLNDDVAFRVITVNRQVDHATICRFRRAHEDALSELFVQVVGLCVGAGMVKTTIVAIDGTKIQANASTGNNVTREQLEKLAAKVFEEAEAIDAEEDRLYGDRRGDEIPPHLIDRKARIEWLKEQLAQQSSPRRGGAKRINSTDPDSRVMKAPTGFVQGFNAQLGVSEDYVIVAADLCNDAPDVGQLEPMVKQAEDNLEAASAAEMQVVVADAGYLSAANLDIDTTAELLLGPTSKDNLDEAIASFLSRPQEPPARSRRPRHDDHRRRVVMEAYVAKHITASEAAVALNAPIGCIYVWAGRLRKSGRLPGVKVFRAPREPSAKDIMLEHLADDPDARAIYKRRGEIVEPVIGHLKEQRGLRRFLHRGLASCRCELRMVATAQNLRRIWVSAQTRNGSRGFTLLPA